MCRQRVRKRETQTRPMLKERERKITQLHRTGLLITGGATMPCGTRNHHLTRSNSSKTHARRHLEDATGHTTRAPPRRRPAGPTMACGHLLTCVTRGPQFGHLQLAEPATWSGLAGDGLCLRAAKLQRRRPPCRCRSDHHAEADCRRRGCRERARFPQPASRGRSFR